jgi:hypothetical protein
MSRRSHTPPAPQLGFDWPLFLKTLPLQPVSVWILCALILRPLAGATPRLLGAVCQGALRRGVADTSFVVYVLVLPPLASALAYLGAGRRRMDAPMRRIGDVGLLLVLVVCAANDFGLVRRTAAGWATIGPGLSALRSACWK